jgi:hypothetical protein
MIQILALEKAGDADAAHWREARAWVVRANRADPQDPLPLYQYFRSYEHQRTQIPQDAGIALLRAFELAPHDDRVRWPLAYWLVGQRRHHEAVIVLSAIAYSPHHPAPQRAEAAALIARLRPLADGTELPPAPPAPASSPSPSPAH